MIAEQLCWKCTCAKCSHKWITKSYDLPRFCVKCKTEKWNADYVEPEKIDYASEPIQSLGAVPFEKKKSISELKDLMGGAILKTSPEFAPEPVDDWIYLEKPTYNEQTGKDDYFRKKPKGQWTCYKSETHWD